MKNPFARGRKRSGVPALVGAGIGMALGAAAWHLSQRGRLRGQVALIMGASRGLGLQIAREFARRGCKVVICARDAEELGRAREDLERRGADVLAEPCDVTSREQVTRAVSLARSRFGHIDILCNVAGVIQVGPVESMGIEDFENAMKVMFWGMLYPTLEVLPGMMERRSGRIVNITSIGGKVAVPHLLPYTAAKFAAVGLSEGLHAELRRYGIKVVTIVPGLMRTGSFVNAYFKGRQEKELAWFGLGASLPGVSMSARRAARQIVSAAASGRSVRVLSAPAKVLALFHGMFPGLTTELLGLANALLPDADGGSRENVTGMEVSRRPGGVVGRALRLAMAAPSKRLHQYPGPKVA
ncbi:MAG: SDR family NAD(P)-dependent oxidoreductase [bacterium]|jgi:NAD(P)-dependent dehydrogenase (short-subunit alcohol dehydrogenase family)